MYLFGFFAKLLFMVFLLGTYISNLSPSTPELSCVKHCVRSSVLRPLRTPCHSTGTTHPKNNCDNGLAPLRGFFNSGFLLQSMIVMFVTSHAYRTSTQQLYCVWYPQLSYMLHTRYSLCSCDRIVSMNC